MDTEEYQQKETMLAAIRTQADAYFKLVNEQAIPDQIEKWLETKSDTFWNMSPIEAIRAGRGDEILILLAARIEMLSPKEGIA